MLNSLYNLSIRLFVLAMGLASLFNKKAKLWKDGRKDLLNDLESWRRKNEGELIWMHCASLGEFEQGRPVIEALRKDFPDVKLLLTFFSPSGFEVRKNYNLVDKVCYLPADTPLNASLFISILHPSSVFFVKYEYWANYFFECKKKSIPLYVISGILRKDQRFFGVFQSFWKKVLDCVTHFFVQNDETFQLLQSVGIQQLTIAGDTRFDRVVKLASDAKAIEEIALFRGDSFCVVGGSTWPEEEQMLAAWHKRMTSSQKDHRIILVPHEITASHIESIQKQFPEAVLWTERTQKDLIQSKVLIINAIGLLSVVYRYGDVAVIGGGFGKGIHNTLEAAVWRIPVLFGPLHQKFAEAVELQDCGGGFSFQNQSELENELSRMYTEPVFLTKSGNAAGEYVEGKAGATALIMNKLKGELQFFSEKKA